MRGVLIEVKTKCANKVSFGNPPMYRFYNIVVKRGPDAAMRAPKIAKGEFTEIARAEDGQEHVVEVRRVKEVILKCS